MNQSPPQNTRQAVKHLAIIMDGNGRWAKKRHLPRFIGHVRGVHAVRQLVKNCLNHGIQHLTLFAFSSENWRRPPEEIQLLMQLLARSLAREQKKLDEQGIQLHVIGQIDALNTNIQNFIADITQHPKNQIRLHLNIAVNYGGQWDIVQAIKNYAKTHAIDALTPEKLQTYLCLAQQPPPDLLIRTGGEQRISNFLLWQMAYTELYFTDCFWPDFNEVELCKALNSFTQRERRFGQTSEQLQKL